MIDFNLLCLERKPEFDRYLRAGGERGCEFSFANLYIWGRQTAAFLGGRLVLFSQFNRKSVYPFPVGSGELKPVLDAIIADAAQRGIPCRLTGLVGDEKEQLEALYPGRWRFHCARDSFDYVYDIHALADLHGKKLQKKRNHFHRFQEAHPNYTLEPICAENTARTAEFVESWYARRLEEDPQADFYMERKALTKALDHREELGMEGLLLVDEGEILAMTLGNPLNGNTFDVNFEKARPDVEGAYAAINREFARYLRDRHPELAYLNREEDMGLEGLRKAKLSYKPHHMVEKCWACLMEDGYDD